MFRVSGRLLVLARVVTIGALLGAASFGLAAPVLADSPSSGGNVIVSAVVAPVRYIVVDDNNIIQQILSNSSDNVTPQVYKNSFKNTPMAMTPNIARQYAAIMAQANTKRAGVIYTRPVNQQPGIVGRGLHLSNHESTWLKKLR